MKTFKTFIQEQSMLAPLILSAGLAAGTASGGSSPDYTVEKGDNLSKIAQKHQLSLDELMKLNPDIRDANKISVGQQIKTGKSVSKPQNSASSVPADSTTATTPKWKSLISKMEGFRSEAYWDDKGKVWTIGKGSTTHPDGRPVRKGDVISKKQADEYVDHYVNKTLMPRLQRIPTWNKMNPNQQSALISFGYNLGPNFYGGEKFETITRALSTEQGFKDVPAAMARYNKSDGVVLPGLVTRRATEGKLWNTPISTTSN